MFTYHEKKIFSSPQCIQCSFAQKLVLLVANYLSTDLSDEPSPTTSTEPEITTLPYQNSALVLSTSQSYDRNPVPFVVNFYGKLLKHPFCLEDF